MIAYFPFTSLSLFAAACTCGSFEPLDEQAHSGPGGGDSQDSVPSAETADSEACAGHCDDGELSCGETAIDCGGDCQPCAEEVIFSGNGLFPAVAANGEVVLASFGNGDHEERLYWTCQDGSGWTTPEEVPDLGHSAQFPRMEVASDGTIHMVVHAGLGNNRAVMHLTWATDQACPGSWSAPTQADDGSDNSCWPQMALDEQDQPHICWTDRDYYEIHYNHVSGGSWQGVEVVYSSTLESCHSDLTVTGGTAHVLWQEGDSPRLPVHSERQGSAFSTPVELSSDFHNWPQIVPDSQGDLHVLYTGRHGDHEIKYRKRAGGSWQPEQTISTRPGEWAFTMLVIDEQDQLHATWHRTDGVEHVYYAIGDALTGSWQAARQVSTDSDLQNRDATLWADPRGTAHHVWLHKEDHEDADSMGEVRYRPVTWQDLE